jgi:autotransporter-associated beta strand protein
MVFVPVSVNAAPILEVEPNYIFDTNTLQMNPQVIPAPAVGSGIVTIGGALWTEPVELGAYQTDSASLSSGAVQSHNFFGLPAGTPYRVFVDNTLGFNPPDTMMRALDPFGNQIKFNDDGGKTGTNGFGFPSIGNNYASIFNSTVNSDGSIRLEVTGWGDHGFIGNHQEVGDYAVYVLLNPPDPIVVSDSLVPGFVTNSNFASLPPHLPYFAYIDNASGFNVPIDELLMRDLDPFGNPNFNFGSPVGFYSWVNDDGTIHLQTTGAGDFDFVGNHGEFGDYDLHISFEEGPGFELAFKDTDFYSFTGLQPGAQFTADVADNPVVETLTQERKFFLFQANDYGPPEQVASFGPLTGTVPANGIVRVGVSAAPDYLGYGMHSQSGEYLMTFSYGTPREWTAPGGGSWSNPSNWNSGQVPNGAGQQARFGEQISSPASISIDTDVILDGLRFDNNVHSYTVTGDGVHDLTLSGAAVIDVVSGAHQISAPIVGSEGLQKMGNGKLVLSGTNTYQGPTLVSQGTLVVNGSHTGGGRYTVFPGATLGGTGTIHASVTVQGELAPGNSPGIIHIDGDYTQTAASFLEIEVGGLTAGTLHDQVQVTGSAKLGGQLEVPIVEVSGYPAYVPQVGEYITLMTADDVSGSFNALVSPNLESVSPGVALRVVKNTNNVQLHFVAPGGIQFVDNTSTAEWSNPTSWLSNSIQRVPESDDIVTINNQNALGNPQRIDVQSEDAFAHQLTVEDTFVPITIGVHEGKTLSAAVGGITVGNHGIIELDSGTLVGPIVTIEAGGILAGTGVVRAYDLSIAGTLQMAIKNGTEPGDPLIVWDTVEVTGEALLGGTLVINAAGLDPGTMAGGTYGMPIPIVDAAGRSGTFSTVQTTGEEDLVFVPVYGPSSSGAGAPIGQSVANCAVAVCIAGYYLGDMNHDSLVNLADAPFFAMALSDPDKYAIQTDENGAFIGDEGWLVGDIGNTEGPDGQGKYHPDGRLTFDDIPAFATKLGMSTSALWDLMQVPEPASAMLLIVASVCCSGSRRIGRVRRSRS